MSDSMKALREKLAVIKDVDQVFGECQASSDEKAEIKNKLKESGIDPDAPLGSSPIIRLLDQAMVRTREAEKRRGYLGMSSIGMEDERTLWLNFRWSNPEKFDGRKYRIFDLGHVLEDVVIKYLRQITIGDAAAVGLRPIGNQNPDAPLFTIRDRMPNGDQYGFSDVGGHFSGHLDLLINGLFESGQEHVSDVKTCKDSKFKAFKKNGMQIESPTYYGQAQSYMHYTNLKRAIYIFYNKDTSEIWVERFKYDHKYFLSLKDKAERIIESPEPPPSSYSGRNYYEIKNYKTPEYQAIYWGDSLPNETNCRNCRFSQPLTNGRAAWHCHKWDCAIPTIQDQIAGCDFHNWIPAMVNAETVEVLADHVCYSIKGRTFFNVPRESKGGNSYTSGELIAIFQNESPADLIADENVETFRSAFGGSLIPRVI
ncbi:MAG: hypothetical protein GY818_06990 [Planctomycetaceae bacterium]|nr:hypothetical protein [Planctomycetaceae bacterium]